MKVTVRGVRCTLQGYNNHKIGSCGHVDDMDLWPGTFRHDIVITDILSRKALAFEASLASANRDE